jgi:protein SCO1/2
VFTIRKRWKKYGLFGLIALILIVGGVTYATHAGGASSSASNVTSGTGNDATPPTINDLSDFGKAPNFTATNVNGTPFTFSSLNGKVRVVTFFYTHCPGPCPMLAGQMEQVQNYLKTEGVLGNKVDLVSVTLDPIHDTLPVIRKWANQFNPDFQSWYFVRPNPNQLPQILKAWDIEKSAVPGTPYFNHTIILEIVNQKGTIMAEYAGDNPSLPQVEKDINTIIAKQT